MEKIKAQIPKGTRDFLPGEVIKRNYIFDSIRSIFEQFGYFPIETPSFELLQTLTGKYGEEGDRLLFKILNSGDFLQKANPRDIDERNANALVRQISKKGLRYDLTVPFARFVVQHQNELSFPFKRYQIQPVWRADRPQKGRYQEFYQCDVDVIGSESLIYEAELIQIYDRVFEQLKLPVDIVFNNRKILAGMAEVMQVTDRFTEMTVAIDKLDKVGEEGVIQEMVRKGIEEDKARSIMALISISDLDLLEKALAQSDLAREGLAEIRRVYDFIDESELANSLRFDPTLARGLNYYTGCIFEVKAKEGDIGSLGGGGRYAELTEVFGRSGMSGVGVSFGAERIYDLMLEKDLFPDDLAARIEVLFVSFDDKSLQFSFKTAAKMRREGIRVDVYPEAAKMKKQMKFANAIQAPFVAIVGEEEVQTGLISLKDMQSGEQRKLDTASLIEYLKS